MSTSNIAFIGDRDSILGFLALGVQIFPVSGVEEASTALRRLMGSDYGVIFITEQLAEGMLGLISDLSLGRALPAIVMVPNLHGSIGLGLEKVRRMIEKAVGVDILSRET